MAKERDETIHKLSQSLWESVRMFAKIPEDAEVTPEVHHCRFFKRTTSGDWQDKLAASEIQYDRLDELTMYFSCIEKNERSRTQDKCARHGPSPLHPDQRNESSKPLPRDYKRKKYGSDQAKQEPWCNWDCDSGS